MGEILSFDRSGARSLPHQRGKTLLIQQDDLSGFIVRPTPAYTDAERAAATLHKTVEEARAVARHAQRTFPAFYIAIVDETLPNLDGAA